MTRYALETHYLGAQAPTVLCFDTEAEAEAMAAKHISTHTGVAAVVIRPVLEEEVQDNLAAPNGFSAALHMVGAAVFAGWFVLEAGRLL